jgi:hypothetical protein
MRVSSSVVNAVEEQADAIYWFADFQDKVTKKMMDKVLKRLKACNRSSSSMPV